MAATLTSITAGPLEIAYEESGPPDGVPAVLLHGFPYDVRAYDGVVERLAPAGIRTIVPWLRGYGPTRFRSPETLRSGAQAALGADLLALLDALSIERAVLAGYDWGGRAACVVSALWPERAIGLVTAGGYNIQDIQGSVRPLPPEAEHRYWYQYYFHGERGRAGLTQNRREFCRLLWRLWSPDWQFDDQTFEATAGSFDQPDFVEVVLHSYRHRFGRVPGDPAFLPIEARLQAQPVITVPTIVPIGESDGVEPPGRKDGDPQHFTGPFEARKLPGIGHDIPQEAPEAFARAVMELAKRA